MCLSLTSVGCLKLTALNEDIPLQFLHGEAPICMKVGARSPVGHTESF